MPSREPLSPHQMEILRGLLSGRVIRMAVMEFPYSYVLKWLFKPYGVHYTAAPIFGLVERDLIKRSGGDSMYVLSDEGRQVADL